MKKYISTLITTIFCYLIYLLDSTNCFAQTMEPPGVQFKITDFFPAYPAYGSPSNDPITEEASGEDWWYDHKNTYDGNGVQDGYICVGYSQVPNYEYNERDYDTDACWSAELSVECCSDEIDLGTTDICNKASFQTMERFDLSGKRLWYKNFNQRFFSKVIQTSDNGFVAIGSTGSTLEFGSSSPIYYNPDGMNWQQFTCTTPNENFRQVSIVKVDADGNVIWNYIYGITAQPDLTYGYEGLDLVEYDDGGIATLRCVGWGSNGLEKGIMFDVELATGYLLAPMTTFSATNTGQTSHFTSIAKLVSSGQNYFAIGGWETFSGSIYSKAFVKKFINTSTSPSWTTYLNGSSGYSITFDLIFDDNSPNTHDILVPVIQDAYSEAGIFATGTNFGDGVVYRLDFLTGTLVGSPIPLGSSSSPDQQVRGYDLKIGITNTSDGGFAIVSNKRAETFCDRFGTVDILPCDGVHDACNDVIGTTGNLVYDYWNNDAWVAKFDDSDNLEWETQFDIDQSAPAPYPGDQRKAECMYSITQTDDGGYALAGNCSRNLDDNYFVKLYNNCANEKSFDIDAIVNADNIITVTELGSSNYVISSGTLTVRGSIHVQNGESLTVEGSGTVLEFADTRRCGIPTNIVVEIGGELIVQDGALLTALVACIDGDGVWDGVQVFGDPTNDDQTTAYQGVCTVQTGGKIEFARAGVILAEGIYKEHDNFEEYVGHRIIENMLETTSISGGGVITCDDANFHNNRKSIVFDPYQGHITGSAISHSHFICDDVMNDPEYVDDQGRRLGINNFLNLWDIHGLMIANNVFENDPGSGLDADIRGIAIDAADAQFQVEDGNQFNYMTYGIIARSSNPANSFTAIDNSFTETAKCISVNGINYPLITNNDFLVGLGMRGDYGIYLEGATSYTIEQNNFWSANTGNDYAFGIVNNYWPINDNDNIIYNNYFDEFLGAAILTSGFHHRDNNAQFGLVISCNEYNLNAYDQYTAFSGLGTNIYPEGIASEQGTTGAPANNIFATDCQTANNANGLAEGELSNTDPGSGEVQAYNYFNSDNGTNDVVPISACTTGTQVNTNTGSNQFDRNTDCPDLQPNLTHGNRMANRDLIANEKGASLKRLNQIKEYLEMNYLPNAQRTDTMVLDSFINDSLDFALIDAEREYNRLLDQQISLFLFDPSLTNPFDSVISVLQNENGINRRMQLVEAYIGKGDGSSALIVLDDLSIYSQLANYCLLNNSLIAFKQQGKTLGDVKGDSIYFTIQAIAEDTAFAGYVQARAILSKVDGRKYPEVIMFNPGQTYQIRKKDVLFNSGAKLLRNYPNPFSGGTTIEANVPLECAAAELAIYNLTGAVLKKYILHRGLNSVLIEANDFSPGIYFYSIVFDEKRLDTDKMICTE